MLWLGHFDLTNFLGVPGQFHSEPYLRAVERLVAAAGRENKILAVLASDDAWARDYAARGFSMIAYGPEQVCTSECTARRPFDVAGSLTERSTDLARRTRQGPLSEQPSRKERFR